MADKLVYISNDDTQNYPFCKLQLGLLYSFPNGLFYNDLKDNTIADKSMYIPKIDKQNYPICTVYITISGGNV